MAELNVAPRTIFCRDNLEVLCGMNSACVDLVYLDPPFNKNKKFTAPTGSSAAGAAFSDTFRQQDVKEEWLETIEEDHWRLHNFLRGVRCMEHPARNYNFCYLVYMAVRLLEIRRVLKETGTVYLHGDPTMSHYLKIMMDCVFGEENFRNEIVWGYKFGGHSRRGFARKHDVILRYSRGEAFVFNDHLMREFETTSNWGRRADGKLLTDWWADIPVINTMSRERTGYPTQKPLALLERIIRASSREGELVLDPFCGCATTCIAAERLGRGWVGVDVSVKAYELIKKRAGREIPRELWDSDWVVFRTDAPARCDGGGGGRGEEKDVYVFSHARAFPNAFKVGVAKDWRQRLGNYQTGDPQRGYRYAFHVRTTRYRELARFIHREFNAHGEWVIGVGLEAIEKAIALKLAE